MVAIPHAAVGHVETQLLLGIVWHHTAVARQDGFHAELFHACEYFLLQSLLLLIPVLWQWTAPTLQVVHLPPSQEGRTGDKLAHFLFRVTEFQEHVAPYTLFTHDGKWHVDAVECHPVDFLLPSVPIPESHGVGEGAVVEVVT